MPSGTSRGDVAPTTVRRSVALTINRVSRTTRSCPRTMWGERDASNRLAIVNMHCTFAVERREMLRVGDDVCYELMTDASVLVV